MAFLAATATSVRAESVSYAQCGTYDAYLLIYKTTERFEELGKLRCGEKVDVLERKGSYSQIRTIDGRVGWVRNSDLSETPPPPHYVFSFGLTEAPRQFEASGPKAPASALTTDDILAIHTMHPGSDFILKRIETSQCAFDMSPQQIQRLRASGVSDKVILAMLQAPVATDSPDERPQSAVDVKIPDGIAFDVELRGNVSSEEVQEGTVVEMQASEDLVVDGVPIVVRGSQARARVLAVRPPGAHGGSGVVAWFMQDVVATNGARIPVNFDARQPDKGHMRNFEGYPYFLTGFHKDNPAIEAGDQRFRVVVHGDTTLTFPDSTDASVAARTKPSTGSSPGPSARPSNGPMTGPMTEPKIQSVRPISTEPAAAQPQAETASQAAPVEAKP